ncbi:ankyrin repeat domain-containing protein [Azonexus hydrophilus]|uniref:Ankyrin repeat domain-containing protein n=1 Tax=Azonexus hydrophilus TaxID=418702 RepID=A0ABZ2XLZ0_9RHOO|nr:ankyrin repeat domain-containing protein [Azonexus hydrophilus]
MRFLIVFLLACLKILPAISADLTIHNVARQGSGEDVRRALAADPGARDLRTAHGSQAIHLAAMNPDISALRALIAAGANINARDGEGATPLHMAAYASRATHARVLLEAGADPLATTDNGRDPTSMARKVKADEAAGVISLWVLKGCKAGKPC